MQEASRLIKTNRTQPIENFDSAFSPASGKTVTESGKAVVTTRVLSNYAAQFRAMFSGKKNLFDCAGEGLPLGLEHKSIETLDSIINTAPRKTAPSKAPSRKTVNYRSPLLFLKEEKESLEELKDLLANGDKSRFRNENESLSSQIKSLLEGREYLFMHFPDGFAPQIDESFLKRVRVELNFFIKQLDIAHSCA